MENSSTVSTIEEDIKNLSHDDLCEITLSTLRRLVTTDKLLSDLPADVTIEELNSQIAVAQGQSITVQILRNYDTPLNVVISLEKCTVHDLKKAIQRNFELKQQRSRSRSKISWKYIWRTYYLRVEDVPPKSSSSDSEDLGSVMTNDNKLVSAYGVKNKSKISFVKRLRGLVKCVNYPWYEQISRQEIVTSNCDYLQVNRTITQSILSQFDHILVDHNHKLLYCYVPKVACTNWKRVLMVLSGKSNETNLSQIPASLVHMNGSLLKLNQLNFTNVQQHLGLSPNNSFEYIRFIVVRHPFERLLSAYRNKLEDHFPSAKYFQARIGRYIIKKYRPKASKKSLQSGADVTFREFVQYLINEGMKPPNVNEHWQPIYQICHPCLINYNFIAKYERLVEDAEIFLDMINASNVQFPPSKPSTTNKKLKSYFQQLSLQEIEQLYNLYKIDFQLFGYGLQDILGYDIG